jgi:protein ImuA
LSLVAGGAFASLGESIPATPPGGRFRLPGMGAATLAELFTGPRDGGWTGFLLPQVDWARPLLWVQERMAILESGRIYPPGLPSCGLIHVEARDARAALWAMEEGLRCAALSAVIGELWGDPASLDFTATRRLAVAAERSRVACWLVRLGGTANLSGARMRWRVASAPSLANSLDRRGPGAPAWDAELFRARGCRPGRWALSHESGAFDLAAQPGDRALGENERRSA